MNNKLFTAFVMFGLTAACGSNDEPKSSDMQPAAELNPQEELSFATTKIEAVSEVDWVFIDLDTNASVVSEADDWDIAFQRYKVKLNANTTPATAAAVLNQEISIVNQVPDQELFQTDLVTDKVEEGLVFNGADPWYDYDFTTHVLTPKANRTYVVYTTSHSLYALSFKSYYDDVGTPANITINVKTLSTNQ